MLSLFFLKRPVFAWVIAIAIMVGGGLAIHVLPVSQHPPIAPPAIAVDAFFPGASAETVENTVTQIIEQKMTGLDDMLYLSGTSSSSGASRIELTFAPGTDPDVAWSKVQNKLQLAMASLPSVVQMQGVKVSKSTRNYLMVVSLVSEDGSMSGMDLRDYAQSNLEKILSRVPGVGEVENMGSQYAMRVWVDVDRLTSYQMTMAEVTAALQSYNVEVSAGQLGGAPALPGQRMNAAVVVQHLLQTPEQFARIPIKTKADGSVIRVGDIGRVELGTERYDVLASYKGRPAAAMTIRQAAGANALETAANVKSKLKEMEPFFPKGVKAIYPYDTTPFTRVAIHEVVLTLVEAVGLVFLVMWLFMGTIRATLIPTIAVPVVLLGTFGILALCGFSVNMETMFAMVLAIGLLVDDAIVVVENVERIMAEEGLSPYEATARSMRQITPALIGIGVVLSAVFLPMAFFSGSTGVIYRQFSVTIAASMMLSVLVALILTPVLCVSLLAPVPKGHEPAEHALPVLRPFFMWFDRVFFRLRDGYVRAVGHILARRLRYVAVFAVLVGALGWLFMRMPTAYLPEEDQGILIIQAVLPSGSTLEQTDAVMQRINTYFAEHEPDAVESFMGVAGVSFAGQGQNMGLGFVQLKDWSKRGRAELKVKAVAGRAMREFAQMRDAMVFAFPPPSVVELGNATGFDLQLQDRGGLGHQRLMEARNMVLGMAASDPRLTRVRPNGMDDTAEYHIDIDWDKAGALGIPISAIHDTIAAAIGGTYVNDFIQAGRVKKVYVQADAPNRMLPKDLESLQVRNASGGMVPFTAFAQARWTQGSPKLERYNAFPSVNFQGEPAPGYSSGDAMRAMEEIMGRLPPGFAHEWTALSYQERMAGSQAPLLYAFSLLVIFLCLAALYESWPVPIAILLTLPLGVIGGVIATSLRGMPNDIFFQIGMLTTLGLTTKNAILIVQFAKGRAEEGVPLVEATLEAAKLRLRPIIMTSLAFGFGVIPLAFASGAGSGAQMAIGTSVLGGMVTSTALVIFFAPLFFVMIQGAMRRRAAPAAP